MKIEQYDIVLVNLDPTTGSEIKKTRPCVVISPDEMNMFLNTIVIAPVTSQSKDYPTRTKIRDKEVSGWIVLDQVRTIDRKRIIRKLGDCSFREIKRIKQIMKELFVD